jgi:uncharacterized protein
MIDLNEINRIVKETMKDLNGSAHSYDHINRVHKIATMIAKDEDTDTEIVEIGSLLHDIGRTVGEPHAENGVNPARQVLKPFNLPQQRVDKIVRIVRYHDVEGRDSLETLEEKIVWDADKLDLIGLTGISRAFHHAGTSGISFNEAVEWCEKRSKREPFAFFLEKSRKIAISRYESMRYFAQQLEKELSLNDIE